MSEALVGLHASSQVFDVDVLVRSVRHMNRARPEQERLSPVGKQWDIRGIGDRTSLESRHCGESLRGYVRAKLYIRVAFCPVNHHFFYRFHVADESEHYLGL